MSLTAAPGAQVHASRAGARLLRDKFGFEPSTNLRLRDCGRWCYCACITAASAAFTVGSSRSAMIL